MCIEVKRHVLGERSTHVTDESEVAPLEYDWSVSCQLSYQARPFRYMAYIDFYSGEIELVMWSIDNYYPIAW